MKEEYIKVYTASRILVKRLQTLMNDAKIHSRIKSDKIPAYEITNYIDELFVLSPDLEKAKVIVDDFMAEIYSK